MTEENQYRILLEDIILELNRITTDYKLRAERARTLPGVDVSIAKERYDTADSIFSWIKRDYDKLLKGIYNPKESLGDKNDTV